MVASEKVVRVGGDVSSMCVSRRLQRESENWQSDVAAGVMGTNAWSLSADGIGGKDEGKNRGSKLKSFFILFLFQFILLTACVD